MKGTMTLLVGADHADLDAARPLLAAIASNIFHFGPVGTGTVYKLLINLIGAIQIASAAEGLALAERAGLDRATVVQAMSSGQAASPQVVRNLQKMIADDQAGAVHFTSALRLKDVIYANRLYGELGAPSSLGEAAERLYQTLCASGRAEASESTIVDLFRQS